MNEFDVLEPVNMGVEALLYPEFEGETYAAGIQSSQMNAATYTARTVWLGFSWMAIRDMECQSPSIRNRLMDEIRSWFQMPGPMDITGTETSAAYRLSQNYPSPFNSMTTIGFDIREKGQVRLRIYNVAGQLVRTLVDG